jgi:hypothetical protein
MKHFWIEFDNPFKNSRFDLELFYIRIDFNDLFSEIRLVILNVVFQYLRPKGKL